MSTALTTTTNGTTPSTNSATPTTPSTHANTGGLLICAISGTCPPEEPVVSAKSGMIYERRLITQHIKLYGTEPTTSSPLTTADLITVHAQPATRPRPPQATNVPSLLQLLQQEWDNLMIESYNLRAQLDSTRRELAHSLYQYDAAQRVIARLIQERDTANAALQDTKNNINQLIQQNVGKYSNGASAQPSSAMDVDGTNVPQQPTGAENGLNERVKAVVEQTSQRLSKTRSADVKATKTKTVPQSMLKSFTQQHQFSLHSASQKGVTCIDIHSTERHVLTTGGADGSVQLFDCRAQQLIDTLKPAHTKAVTSTHFVNNTDRTVFSTSADSTANLYSGDFALKHTYKHHTNGIVGAAIHPSYVYAATASTDKTYQLHDLTSLTTVHIVPSEYEYTSLQYHPDGVLLGLTASDGNAHIHDTRELKQVASLQHSASSTNLTTIAFSINGYIAATGDGSGVCKVWDLRKPAEHVQQIELSRNNSINSVKFDVSALYLAVASSTSTALYDTKTYDTVVEWQCKGKVTDVAMCLQDGDQSYVATTSMDRHLRLYTAPAAKA